MKLYAPIALLVFASFPLMAFDDDKVDDSRLVTVPQKYVSSEGLTHKVEGGGLVTQITGMGKEIGIATRDGLNAVVDVSEKFGATGVGHFVMFMIAWKILGHELVRLILGIPLLIAIGCVWWASMKRFFWGRRVLASIDGATKIKTWVTQPAYSFDSSDARTGCGLAHIVAAAAILIALLVMVIA